MCLTLLCSVVFSIFVWIHYGLLFWIQFCILLVFRLEFHMRCLTPLCILCSSRLSCSFPFSIRKFAWKCSVHSAFATWMSSLFCLVEVVEFRYPPFTCRYSLGFESHVFIILFSMFLFIFHSSRVVVFLVFSVCITIGSMFVDVVTIWLPFQLRTPLHYRQLIICCLGFPLTILCHVGVSYVVQYLAQLFTFVLDYKFQAWRLWHSQGIMRHGLPTAWRGHLCSWPV